MIIENGILKSIEDSDLSNGTIIIPETVTEIADEVFIDCKELKSIEIPDNVKVIGHSAFVNCEQLKSVKLPKDLKQIKDSTFKNCSMLTSIEVPDSVTIIGDNAFSDCIKLASVNLGNNLESIGEKSFNKCNALTKIDFPDSLKTMGKSCFYDCKNLRSVVIPPQITKIPENAFRYCVGLKKLVINEGVTKIGENAFNFCYYLRDVSLPESLKEIEKGAFQKCNYLREIVIPKNVTKIAANGFCNCEHLKKISLPEGLKFLGSNCFRGCYALHEIHLPESIEEIEPEAFAYCLALNKVNIPTGLTSIPKSMFHACIRLTSIHIPENIKVIEKDAFGDCNYLTKINLPEGLEEIQDNAFEECKFLRQIILPTTLKTIGESAFKDCFNLKELNLPNGIETLKKNFIKNCKKIKNFTVPTTVKNLRNPNDTYFSYVEKTDDGFTVMHKSTEKSYPIEDIKIEIPLFFNYKDINPNLINEQKNDVIAELYNLLNYSISSEQMDKFMRNHNFTFFKKIMKNIPTNRYSGFNKDAFCIGYYNLGGFIPMADYNGKKVDYSQKVAGKLQEYIDREEFRPYENLSYSFETMKADGFKKDFTDFYLGNLRELMSENIFYREFISRVYNQFEEVQATNTSNRGSQRQLKPTIEKFRNYFRGSIFKGVTPETQQIADTVSAYSNSQYTFDKAVDIMNEFEIKKSPNNILSIPLVQELSPFENIDSTAEKIEELQVETAGNLAQVASRQLTYEWLEKNDPTNLILGKLCSCCAHLEGAGYGIMHASIVHPNVQNLVVRDDEDKIIAKSTLFINPNEQYGLLNNFEVRNGFTYEENIETYKTFMQGIADFAKQYNIEHPDKPLKQINVGGGNNDLLGHLLKYNEKAEELFESLDYGNYGNGPHNYRGDSYFSQFIVWKNNELEKNKEEEIEKIQEIEKQI